MLLKLYVLALTADHSIELHLLLAIELECHGEVSWMESQKTGAVYNVTLVRVFFIGLTQGGIVPGFLYSPLSPGFL